MLERSPATAVSAPGTAASASFARVSLRACSTTRWPSATMSLAAICPRPSAEPVTKMRAILAILVEADELHAAPAPLCRVWLWIPARHCAQRAADVPVRTPANRPRCVRVLKYVQRSRRVRATRRSSTCTLAAAYLCCLLFCFLFSDGHGRPTEILRSTARQPDSASAPDHLPARVIEHRSGRLTVARLGACHTPPGQTR